MDRLASNILACVWDLMESPGFAVAYENAVHASLDVLLGDILRSCFPSPSSALSSPSSESSPSPAPVSAARAAGPVKLANIVLNLYMVLKRLLRAEVTEW